MSILRRAGFKREAKKYTPRAAVNAPVPTQVLVSPGSCTIVNIGTQQLTAQIVDQFTNTYIGPVTWQSSNPGVASVDANGLVTYVSPGSATITAFSPMSLCSGVCIATMSSGIQSAAITGTAASSFYETAVVSGGRTIVITLTGTTFVAAGATFDNQRQGIINGIVASTSPANGFNNLRSTIPVTACVRTSAAVVTITLPALASYSIAANETLTVTVPATALSSGNAVVALPSLTITEGAPIGAGWLANLPANYTNVVTDYAFNETIPATDGDSAVGSGGFWNVTFNGAGNLRRVVDTTGAISPQYVLEHNMYAGMPSGTGAGKFWGVVPSATQEYYLCLRTKWDSNYEWNVISNKFFIFEPDHIIIEGQHNSAYWYVEISSLGTTYNCNIATPTIALDEWHTIEIQVVRGTPGLLRIWMDGVLYMDHTVNVPVASSAQDLSIANTWGGITDPKTRDSWRWTDHIYIATPP